MTIRVTTAETMAMTMKNKNTSCDDVLGMFGRFVFIGLGTCGTREAS